MTYLIIILSLLAAKPIFADQIVLVSGESRKLPPASSVWVENKNMIKVTDHGSHFTVQGHQPGHSELRLGEKHLQVDVLSLEQDRARHQLLDAVKKSVSLRLKVKSGRTVVEGRLLFFEEWEKLGTICSEHNCHYSLQVKMNPSILSKIQARVAHLLKNHSLPVFPVVASTRLEMRIPKQSSYFQDIANLIQPYGIEVVRDLDSVDIAPLVKVQITLVEVKKSMMRKLGIQWPASYQAQLVPRNSQLDSPLSLTAQFFEQNGFGKILASPNLLCRSGKEAEFVAGGEFPIKIINFKIQDIIWKKYGILLRVKPLADYSGRMSIALETEVSSIDDSRTIDGVPGLFTNRVHSHFDLTSSRMIALSGLIKSENGKSAQGLPGLTQIPILGPLFSSQDFQENKTELVIFVQPTIVQQETIENSTQAQSEAL